MLFTLSLFFPNISFGQSVSLSVSPPIYESVMAPGESAIFEYQISNNGPKKQIKFDIVPSFVSNEYGESRITENPSEEERELILSMFGITSPDIITLGSIATVDRGETVNIKLSVKAPQTINSGDYYFAFIFEALPESNIGGFGSGAGAIVGSNIIISIVSDTEYEKKAKITYFSAPIITDSLTDITYRLMIENNGDYYFKPRGEITVENFLGSYNILNIAPLNILSGSKRIIPCIEDEKLVECKLNKKFLIGVYKAELKFETGINGETYTMQKTTIAFPFSIILLLTGLFSFLMIIKKKYIKR